MGQTDSCYPLACTSKATVNLPFVVMREECGPWEGKGEGGFFFNLREEDSAVCTSS